MQIISGLDIHKKEVKKDIKRIIQKSGLIVFPTETVYGIGADATNPEAVKKIFIAKGRPSDNPLIVHLATIKDLPQVVESIPELAIKLMDTYWPGPLTIVFKKKSIIPKEVSGGLDTVGIRIPSNQIALEVIKAAEVPICAPSANISGKPSSTLFKHVLEDFTDKVDMMIDGGQASIGLESTVIDMTTPIPVLLRPGAITKEMIEKTLEIGIMDATEEHVKDIPRAPGMKYTHYAPQGKVLLIEGTQSHVIDYINNEIKKLDLKRVGVIATEDYLSMIPCFYQVNLGHENHLDEIARNIFLALRQMDAMNIAYIFIPALPKHDLGKAIMNRLMKAAGNAIISV